MQEIDGLLVARDWKHANYRAEKLLKRISSRVIKGGRELIGALVLERAVALAGLGRARDAEWYACVASEFWEHSADQLLRYGDTGLRLRKAVRGEGGGEVHVHPVIVDVGGGMVVLYPDQLQGTSRKPVFHEGGTTENNRIKPPVVVSKTQPHYPEGVYRAKGEGRVVVMVTIDKNGRPDHPGVLLWSSYVPVVYLALDALKDWRFKPATLNGQPVEVLYELTLSFSPWHTDPG